MTTPPHDDRSAGVNRRLPSGAALSPLPDHGVVVTEDRETAGRIDQPKDEHARFFLVVSGNAHLKWGERRCLVGAGTLCHVPAGLAIQQEIMPNNDVLVYVLRYRSGLLSAALSVQLAALGLAQLNLGSATVNQARAVQLIFREMLFEQDTRREGWEMILRSRLIDIAVRMVRLTQRKPAKTGGAFEPASDSLDRIARYTARLNTQFFRQETLNDAARSVGLSTRQFSKLFRKHNGQSWRQHVLALRLKHAAALLVDTDRSVSAVAFESGFDDMSNFHHFFKSTYGCAPQGYREQHRIKLPAKAIPFVDAAGEAAAPRRFQFRGMKGWSWTPDQYLEEIPVLAELKMNFLMNCYRSFSAQSGGPWRNEWWLPMSGELKRKFVRIIRACQNHDITFCLAMHPQLASPRPLVFGNEADIDAFYQHYEWAQKNGVKWFAVCLDDTTWGPDGPAGCAACQSALVNEIFQRLRANDRETKMIFCPASFWGDGSNPEDAAYLTAVARVLNPEIYVFWNGDAIITPRVTRVAAQNFRSVVGHRLFLWDNYPVNDGNPTMHLGPLSGREPDLCDVVDGYMSNAMCSQNEINRLPLATAADYAYAPDAYKPWRSIGQSILRLAGRPAEQAVLKKLVEQYPGFIVAGGGTGTNPARTNFRRLLDEDASQKPAAAYVDAIEQLHTEMRALFPARFSDAKQTLLNDIRWMKQELKNGTAR